MISTHNGMARDYAIKLKESMSGQNINIPVIKGGVLNQKVENLELPVDVIKEIKELGFFPYVKLEGQLPLFLAEKLEK